MNKIIVVVDDEKDIRDLLERMLREEGYETHVCVNAIEALEKVRHFPVDLIISDIHMHGINGIELLDKTAELDPYVPTILITGFGTEETAKKAAEKGAAAFLEKPFQKEALLQKVKQVIATPRRANRGRILIADDDESVRNSGSRILKSKGYHVELADNGREAVEKVRVEPFDIVIMDMNMPVMQGDEATKQIRALPDCPTVILSTGEAVSEQISRAKEAGAFYSTLNKPYQAEQLVRTVRWVQAERRDAAQPRRERPYTEMLQVRSGPGKTVVFISMIAASLVFGVVFSFFIYYAQEATGKALKPFKALAGYFDRIEHYLERDEQREIQRMRESGE